jgi:hypothetical protein
LAIDINLHEERISTKEIDLFADLREILSREENLGSSSDLFGDDLVGHCIDSFS